VTACRNGVDMFWQALNYGYVEGVRAGQAEKGFTCLAELQMREYLLHLTHMK
jgi:hypothetical protein